MNDYPPHIDLQALTLIAGKLADRVQQQLQPGQGGEVRLTVSPERVKAYSGLLAKRLVEVLTERGALVASARQWTGAEGSGIILIRVDAL